MQATRWHLRHQAAHVFSSNKEQTTNSLTCINAQPTVANKNHQTH